MESEENKSDSIVTIEESGDMPTRQLRDLLTNSIFSLMSDIITIIETSNLKFQVECSKLRADFSVITEQLESKLKAATAEIPAKIRQENKKLTQKFYNEVQKLSGDICTLRGDTERKVQEVSRTIGGISNALIERIDAHMVDTKKMTERISQEMEELRLDYSLFNEQMNLEQKTW